MQQTFRFSAVVPPGFMAEGATFDDAAAVITVRHTSRAGACPRCGWRSDRVHSRYRRHLLDLPLGGRPVRLVVVARRFRCDAVLCGQRIFTERFEEDVLAPRARRTASWSRSSIISDLLWVAVLRRTLHAG
jgi:transposase